MKRNAERQSGRLTITVPIAIRARRGVLRFKEHTSTVNISRGGISFRSRRRYAPGMTLRVEFQSASDHSGRTQKIPAEVVRVSSSDRGSALVGARFEDAALASVVYAELLSAQMRISLALVEVMQALSPGAEIGDVIDSICRAAARAMEAERTVVILLNKGEPTLYSHGRCTKLSAPQARLAGSLLGAGRVARQLMSIRAPAAASRFRARLEKLFKRRIRSLLSVPLSEENGVSPGLLVVLDKRHGSFTRRELRLRA